MVAANGVSRRTQIHPSPRRDDRTGRDHRARRYACQRVHARDRDLERGPWVVAVAQMRGKNARQGIEHVGGVLVDPDELSLRLLQELGMGPRERVQHEEHRPVESQRGPLHPGSEVERELGGAGVRGIDGNERAYLAGLGVAPQL